MGIYAYAFLAYGYDIGDLGEYVYSRGENDPPPWYDEEKIDDYGYEDTLIDFLLERLGYTLEHHYGDDYNKALEELGVSFRRNGGYEGTLFMYTKIYHAYWGHDQEINPTDLVWIDPRWDMSLKWALEQLEIEINEEPQWVLFTHLG